MDDRDADVLRAGWLGERGARARGTDETDEGGAAAGGDGGRDTWVGNARGAPAI
ncbi:hypothetical protein ACWKSP_33110 [Micromonosporaceae bacterium Da 78-11]